MIPIENLYYLLCYAWNILPEQGNRYVSAEKHSSILDLLSHVLLNSLEKQLKRGMPYQYQEVTDSVASIKGKILLEETVQRNFLRKNQVVCQFDEFTIDSFFNRVLKTTLLNLKKTSLPIPLQRRLTQALYYFRQVSPISLLDRQLESHLRSSRSWHERLLLSICILLKNNLQASDQEGALVFRDFLRDEKQMPILFEAFVRNFYRLEQKTYSVRREIIKWQVEAEESERRFLPVMKTDISLESPERKLIIDTKYYVETFQNYYDVQKIHSTHLYQVFSYVKNSPIKEKPLTGMLLYPVVSQALRLNYQSKSNSQVIQVNTLNLTQPWPNIRQELLQLIQA